MSDPASHKHVPHRPTYPDVDLPHEQNSDIGSRGDISPVLGAVNGLPAAPVPKGTVLEAQALGRAHAGDCMHEWGQQGAAHA